MGEWMPIESAPRDGTGILAMSTHLSSARGGAPVMHSVEFDGDTSCFLIAEDGWPFYDATHWMPLPEPPHDQD